MPNVKETFDIFPRMIPFQGNDVCSGTNSNYQIFPIAYLGVEVFS